MTDFCEQFERSSHADRGSDPMMAGDDVSDWNEHLASCTQCREQTAANAALRDVFPQPPPGLDENFDTRMRERLERHVEGRALAAGTPSSRLAGRIPQSRPSGLWILAAYVAAASVASVLLLYRLPWQALVLPPGIGLFLGVTSATVAILSPLLLLDRLGIVRAPG